MKTNNYKSKIKKRKTGVVVSDKMDKTRVVEAERLIRHRIYNKVIKTNKKFYVHDQENESQLGDTVVIEETRPISRLKRWKIIEISKKAEK